MNDAGNRSPAVTTVVLSGILLGNSEKSSEVGVVVSLPKPSSRDVCKCVVPNSNVGSYLLYSSVVGNRLSRSVIGKRLNLSVPDNGSIDGVT